jgi:serine/threonine protein kinase
MMQGHVRLIDFGLAKIGVKGSGQDGDTNTFCGTSEYLAPEVIAKAGYGKAADWWAFGSILFEILTGTLPFIHQNPDKMYDRILNDPLEFPKKANSKDPDEYVMSYPAMDLLRGLLTKNISDRLGSNPTSSIDAIKKMPFFARFDFNLVLQMHYQPGYIPDFVDDPNLVHKNFDSEFTQESVDESYDHRKMRPSIELKTTFEGFDFDFGQKVVSSQ